MTLFEIKSENALFSWLCLIIYLIISFLVAVSSIKVFDRCPDVDKDNIAKSRGTGIGLCVTNAFIVIILLILFFMNSERNLPALVDSSKSYLRGGLFILLSLAFAISVLLTCISEFIGSDTINECQFLNASSEGEMKEFLDAAVMINRLYGLVCVITIMGILFVLKFMYEGFVPYMQVRR